MNQRTKMESWQGSRNALTWTTAKLPDENRVRAMPRSQEEFCTQQGSTQLNICVGALDERRYRNTILFGMTNDLHRIGGLVIRAKESPALDGDQAVARTQCYRLCEHSVYFLVHRCFQTHGHSQRPFGNPIWLACTVLIR